MRVILGCLLLAACGGNGPSSSLVDASAPLDAASSNDAASQRGLSVMWDANPDVPGSIDSNITITSAAFAVARLEVIGDAGASAATTMTDLPVVWSASSVPARIVFSDAPNGLYSKVSMRIDGELVAPSYELRGMARIGGMMEPFMITDTAALQVDIDNYAVTVTSFSMATLPIRLEIDKVTDAINFGSLRVVGGVRTLDQTDAAIAAVRTELRTDAFRRGD